MATGIGQRIKQRRKELNITQEELATKMGLKSKSTICKIERGEDNLTAITTAQYAAALDTTVSYLLGKDEPDLTKESIESHDKLLEKVIREVCKNFSDDILDDPETAHQIMEIVDIVLKINPKARDGLLVTLKNLTSQL